jgi:ElaB/YqjD/DUF883 family membrane-anchored ribosome-binding protein
MEDQNQPLIKEMEETRSSLTEKLEVLESHVAEKIEPVAAAVERVTEAAAEIVENVKETVQDVTEKVEKTVTRVSSVFNLQQHTERHPWMVVGAALTAGCLLGTSMIRRVRHGRQAETTHAGTRQKHGRDGGNGRSHRTESEPEKRARQSDTPRKEGLFTEEMRRLKELAVGALMGAVRDLAKRAIPGVVGERLAEEVDSLTARFGAQPIREPILSAEPAQQPEVKEEKPERKESAGTAASRLRSGDFRSGRN